MTALLLACALSGFLAACVPSVPTSQREALERAPEAQKPIYRCARPTKTGAACRRRVAKPGPCWQHQDDNKGVRRA